MQINISVHKLYQTVNMLEDCEKRLAVQADELSGLGKAIAHTEEEAVKLLAGRIAAECDALNKQRLTVKKQRLVLMKVITLYEHTEAVISDFSEEKALPIDRMKTIDLKPLQKLTGSFFDHSGQ